MLASAGCTSGPANLTLCLESVCHHEDLVQDSKLQDQLPVVGSDDVPVISTNKRSKNDPIKFKDGSDPTDPKDQNDNFTSLSSYEIC